MVITTLDRLGRSTRNMLAFADELRARRAGLRVFVHRHGWAGTDGASDHKGARYGLDR